MSDRHASSNQNWLQVEEDMTSVRRREGPGKEVDVDLLVFIERYANDLLKWDVISFFARNPDVYDTADNVARCIGRSPRIVRSELGDLAMLGILERDRLGGDHIYYLTRHPELRRLALRFAQHLNGWSVPGESSPKAPAI